MSVSTRRELVDRARRVVIKVGTRVLTTEDGQLDAQRVECLAREVQQLTNGGRQVVLVSSGAVGAGLSQLGLRERPNNLARLQAIAAIGQTKLIEQYDRYFRQHQRHAAQVLLTAADVVDRAQYLNIRNTLLQLLEMGAIPIVNENDTVAVEELMTTFGDNDRLAAVVTNLLQAQLLVILSDVPGLYDGDPRAPGSRLLDKVVDIDSAVSAFVIDRPSPVSRGGMTRKLEAARLVTLAGEHVVLASGTEAGVLERIFDGEAEGTWFPAGGKPLSPRKRWIGISAAICGELTVDAGAAAALCQQDCSLLPIGVVRVVGEFNKGDAVAVRDEQGRELARGLSNYTSRELAQIIRCRTSEIAARLGHCPYEEAIHRDNLMLV